jgi:hypothetical protein
MGDKRYLERTKKNAPEIFRGSRKVVFIQKHQLPLPYQNFASDVKQDVKQNKAPRPQGIFGNILPGESRAGVCIKTFANREGSG